MAYNLNCWLMAFTREEDVKVATLQHTTPATARLRVLFSRHQDLAPCRAGVGVSYRLEIGDLAVTRERSLT